MCGREYGEEGNVGSKHENVSIEYETEKVGIVKTLKVK
jgi:hypothetical protein